MKRFEAWIAGALLAGALSSRPAAAQEIECGSVGRAERRAIGRQQRVKAAAVATGIAGATLIASLVTYGWAQHGVEACGLTGCFLHPGDAGKLAAGATAAAGIGMAVVAVPALIEALVSDREPPRRAGRMGWGLSLTATGVGLVAANVVLGVALGNAPATPLGRDVPFGNGTVTSQALPGQIDTGATTAFVIAQSLIAAAHLGAGIPLWAQGARAQPRAAIVPAGAGAALVASF